MQKTQSHKAYELKAFNHHMLTHNMLTHNMLTHKKAIEAGKYARVWLLHFQVWAVITGISDRQRLFDESACYESACYDLS